MGGHTLEGKGLNPIRLHVTSSASGGVSVVRREAWQESRLAACASRSNTLLVVSYQSWNGCRNCSTRRSSPATEIRQTINGTKRLLERFALSVHH